MLKSILSKIEVLFSELIQTDQDLLREKLTLEIEKLEKNYQKEINRMKSSFKLKANWHIIDMIVGQFFGFLTPWVEDAKKINVKLIENDIKEYFLNQNNIPSCLFFIYELWNKNIKLPDIPDKIGKMEDEYLIWGEAENELPWYER